MPLQTPRFSFTPSILLALSSPLLLNSCQLFKKKTPEPTPALRSSLSQPKTTTDSSAQADIAQLPSPGPIDLTSLENLEITEPKAAAPSSRKRASPFRAPDATQALVGETEANRIAISPSLKKITTQTAKEQGGLIARPPKVTP